MTGVAGVVAMARNLDESVRHYSAMFGVQTLASSQVQGAATANLLTRGWVITVASPDDEKDEIAQELERRGEVPFLVKLRTTNPKNADPLDMGRSHQARCEIVV